MSSIPESKTRGSTGFTFEFTVFEGTLFLPITGKPTRSGLPAIKAGRRSFKRLAFSVPTGKVGNSQMALDLDGIDAESSTHTPFFCDIEDVVVIAASFQSEVGPMGLFIGQITLAEDGRFGPKLSQSTWIAS
ncbi:hypothetical protein QP028_12640 [Corynebacterium suedekumii]|nr:hypothetical protein QP028_12640 [Corynebacterium suedekumii]